MYVRLAFRPPLDSAHGLAIYPLMYLYVCAGGGCMCGVGGCVWGRGKEGLLRTSLAMASFCEGTGGLRPCWWGFGSPSNRLLSSLVHCFAKEWKASRFATPILMCVGGAGQCTWRRWVTVLRVRYWD
jgi:hypothetical protein